MSKVSVNTADASGSSVQQDPWDAVLERAKKALFAVRCACISGGICIVLVTWLMVLAMHMHYLPAILVIFLLSLLSLVGVATAADNCLMALKKSQELRASQLPSTMLPSKESAYEGDAHW